MLHIVEHKFAGIQVFSTDEAARTWAEYQSNPEAAWIDGSALREPDFEYVAWIHKRELDGPTNVDDLSDD